MSLARRECVEWIVFSILVGLNDRGASWMPSIQMVFFYLSGVAVRGGKILKICNNNFFRKLFLKIIFTSPQLSFASVFHGEILCN